MMISSNETRLDISQFSEIIYSINSISKHDWYDDVSIFGTIFTGILAILAPLIFAIIQNKKGGDLEKRIAINKFNEGIVYLAAITERSISIGTNVLKYFREEQDLIADTYNGSQARKLDAFSFTTIPELSQDDSISFLEKLPANL